MIDTLDFVGGGFINKEGRNRAFLFKTEIKVEFYIDSKKLNELVV